MPGVVFDFDKKVKLAQKLVDFGANLLDIMPTVSEAEFRVTKELTGAFGSKVSATCRAKKEDINTAMAAGASRITLFAPLSDLHITQKLKITREENLKRALEMIDYAAAHGLAVDFAGEDSSRADAVYLRQFIGELQGKVAVFFVADTVGCLTPESTRKLIWYVKNNFSGDVGVHFHNDFGMATANTVEAVISGADYFSGTFTGIGERAGNAPIEEVCTALHYLCGRDINLDREVYVKLPMLKEICNMVQEFSCVKLQRHKPIVGENAFAHESGVHVDGILKNPRTYEFIAPEAVGQERKIVLGKHSGRKALEYVIGEKYRAELDDGEMEIVLNMLKDKCGANGDISDEEIASIIAHVKGNAQMVLV